MSNIDEEEESRSQRRKPAKNVPTDRLPPNSPEAEQGVLGCVLDNPAECLDRARELIHQPQAFYDLRHQTLWAVLLELHDNRSPIDAITVMQRLKELNSLEAVGGAPYLSALANSMATHLHVEGYAEIVRQKFNLRRWLALSGEIASRIYEEPDTDELVSEISAQVFGLCEAQQRKTEKTMSDVMADVTEHHLDKFQRGKKHKIGPMTGFNYLDNILPGLGKGQLIVLAARPRTGKSAMLMQWVEHVTLVEKLPTAFFSLEMTATSLGARAVFQRGGADFTKFLNGFMSEEDIQKLTSAIIALGPAAIVIDDSPSISIEDLEIRARRLVRQKSVAVIFVDYFQLLYVRQRHSRWNTNDEMAHISKRLKALARELKIPIVVAAQMNREIEKETHRRPRLSDLRDTGQLEQDADVVMFLWKPNVSSDRQKKRISHILPRMPVPEAWRPEKGWQKNLAAVTCTVEKQREGRSGEDADLMFIKPWTRFVDAWRPGDDEPAQAEMEDDDEEI